MLELLIVGTPLSRLRFKLKTPGLGSPLCVSSLGVATIDYTKCLFETLIAGKAYLGDYDTEY